MQNVDATQVTLLAHSSLAYNCHSYAWHVSEDGNTVWVNDLDANHNDIDNVNRYWDDDSYVETTQANHRKVFYHPETQNDHSAVTTSQSDWFISKWTNGPLVRHKYDNCPYWNSSVNLKYYKLSNPAISSNSYAPLCNNIQRTFSESAFTNIDLIYDWNYTSPLDEVSDDDESTYTVKGTSQNGQGIISLTVTTPSGATATANKNVWVGKPSFDGIYLGVILTDPPHDEACINQIISLGVTNSNAAAQGVIGYHWLFGSWDSYFMGYEIMRGTYFNTIANFMLDDYTPEMQIVGVSAENTCDCGNPQYKDFYAVDCGGGYFMVFSPNPVVGETILSIESNSTEKTFDDNTDWELEVYNQSQILKAKKTKLRGKSTQIQTNGWKEGVYMVRVKYSRDGKPGEILTGKLVVRK